MAASDEGSLGKATRDVLKRLREAIPLLKGERDAFLAEMDSIGTRMAKLTGEHGEIDLHISTNRILVGEEVAYRSEAKENNLAFDLFSQGLRRLVFSPGINTEELTTFVERLGECVGVSRTDEDFVTLLWREALPNVRVVAIDGFTEKIFMSDEHFVRNFRQSIDDVVPGLVGFPEEDSGDKLKRPRETLDDAALTGEIESRTLRSRTALGEEIEGVHQLLDGAGDPVQSLHHLAQLLASFLVKQPSPMGDEFLRELVGKLLAVYIQRREWQGFADAARSFRALVDAGTRFPGPIQDRLSALPSSAAGRLVVEAFARTLDPSETNVTAWARWFFTTSGGLSAPDLLAVINRVDHQAGVDFLKDLLRRQGTASLDPWADRLRDPNPGVVLEVLDVILNSALGEQARPLLIETLAHPSPEVKARSIEGLSGSYDLKLREALLPMLRDESAHVRRAVVHMMIDANDRTVSPYLASTVRSAMFPTFDEDEQRLYFEALGQLGGEKFLEVFRGALRLEGDGSKLSRLFKRGQEKLTDDPVRRGAVSGLAIIGSREALALIREVHKRADLELAGHCDVVLRLAARGEKIERVRRPAATRRDAVEMGGADDDLSAAASLLGDEIIFDLDQLAAPPPARPTPTSEADKNKGASKEDILAHRADSATSERPLLAEGETFLPDDFTELKAEPDMAEGSRFRLTSPRVALVGVQPPEARPSIRPSGPPVKVVERVAQAPRRPSVTNPTPPPATTPETMPEVAIASLEDLLKGYIDTPEKSPGGVASQMTPAAARASTTNPSPPPRAATAAPRQSARPPARPAGPAAPVAQSTPPAIPRNTGQVASPSEPPRERRASLDPRARGQTPRVAGTPDPARRQSTPQRPAASQRPPPAQRAPAAPQRPPSAPRRATSPERPSAQRTPASDRPSAAPQRPSARSSAEPQRAVAQRPSTPASEQPASSRPSANPRPSATSRASASARPSSSRRASGPMAVPIVNEAPPRRTTGAPPRVVSQPSASQSSAPPRVHPTPAPTPPPIPGQAGPRSGALREERAPSRPPGVGGAPPPTRPTPPPQPPRGGQGDEGQPPAVDDLLKAFLDMDLGD